jgi:hypothetical protein
MGLQKTVFGRVKYKPNTFIGGVSATINTPDLIATKLGISVTKIKAFSVIGSNIQFAVTGVNYAITNNAFLGNSSITYFRDIDAKCYGLSDNAFRKCLNLNEVVLPNTILGSYSINSYPVVSTLLTKVILTGTTIIPNGAFNGLPSISQIDIGNVVTWQKSAISTSGTVGLNGTLTELNIKKCTSFGTLGSGARGIGGSIKTGLIFNVNIALLTSNAGAVNDDMLYYKTTYGCVINFYDNAGNYVSTL